MPTSILLFSKISAQQPQIRFERISAEDGLSKNNVTALLQDKTGFIWIGTFDGLNRYDGYEYNIYRQTDEPGSISHNYIISLAEDKEGNIWIGTIGGGVNKFDPHTETFVHYKHEPGNPTYQIIMWKWSILISRELYGSERREEV